VSEKAQDPNGRVVVYYAGHGQTQSTVGYLIPVDAPLPSHPQFRAKAYPIQTLKIKAQEAQARHVLFACDSCFSGSIFTPIRGANEYVLSAAREPVRMFLTAGSADETVPDVSFFRQEFTRGIAGSADLNRDGYVTGSELATYVKQTVRDRAGAMGKKLTPQAGVSEQEGLNRGDIVFRVAITNSPSAAPSAPKPPASAGMDLNAIKALAEAQRLERSQWAEWQQRMQADFDQLATIGSDAALSPDLKRDAWKKFLEAYPTENPHSQDDNRLRQRALTELSSIGERQAAPAPSSGAPVTVAKAPRTAPDPGTPAVVAQRPARFTLKDEAQTVLTGVTSMELIGAKNVLITADSLKRMVPIAHMPPEVLAGWGITVPTAGAPDIGATPSWAASSGSDTFGVWSDIKAGNSVLRFRWVAPSTFMMGSPPDERAVAVATGQADPSWMTPEVLHRVTLSKGYWIADTPCTNAFYQAVMGGTVSPNPQHPVVNVTWNGVQDFIRSLNARHAAAPFRLPTEAEWECASRAGTRTATYAGNLTYSGLYSSPLLDEIAWYGGNGRSTHPVQQKKPNSWGLYDTLGNVWQWCNDWYADYPPGDLRDPTGPTRGAYHILRGGSWNSGAAGCRAAHRSRSSGASGDIGFRLAASP
jgi:formylglycine-generating enzyme required for sulfatase activity